MLTEERYKQLMENVGMPNSRSLLQALQQCAVEAALLEREACAKVCDGYTLDDDGEHDDARRCARRIRAR